jgi:hypothetical protein
MVRTADPMKPVPIHPLLSVVSVISVAACPTASAVGESNPPAGEKQRIHRLRRWPQIEDAGWGVESAKPRATPVGNRCHTTSPVGNRCHTTSPVGNRCYTAGGPPLQRWGSRIRHRGEANPSTDYADGRRLRKAPSALVGFARAPRLCVRFPYSGPHSGSTGSPPDGPCETALLAEQWHTPLGRTCLPTGRQRPLRNQTAHRTIRNPTAQRSPRNRSAQRTL